MSLQARLDFVALCPRDLAPSALTLRDYQIEAVDAVLAAATEGMQRPLIVLPTGAGKTIVFSDIIRRRPGRALVLAHRDELIRQAVDKLRLIMPDADIGIVKAQRNETWADIVVASVQSLSPKRLGTLGAFQTVVIDEAHHAAASSYRTIMKGLGSFDPGGPLTLGVTATPERGDGVGLNRAFQQIVFRRSLVWMIAKGYLSDLKALQVHLAADFAALKIRQGDYVDAEVAEMLSEAHAPQIAAKAFLAHAEGRRALIFTPTVALAYEMAGAFRDAGIAAEAIHGGTSADERQAILGRLRSGKTRAVANASLLTEGYDEPAVDCIVMARPTRSRGLFLQMLGRGLRLHPGKENCLAIDLVGSTSRHDLVTAASLFGLNSAPKKGSGGSRSLLQTVHDASARGQGVQDELGEIVSVPVNLFRKMTWVQLAGGRWTLPLPDGRLELAPQADGWSVDRLMNGQRPVRLAEGVTLEWGQGIAEEQVRSEKAEWLTDPERPWRRRPASGKQRQILEREGLWRSDMTAGEASDLLTQLFAGRRRR